MPSHWSIYVNAILGALVVTVGAWLASNAFSSLQAAVVLLAAAAFLWWRGRTISLVWAWSTLFLGLECFAWPITTMLRVRSAGRDPSDDEMGAILSAIVMGLFSAVFWISFAYGLFKRAKAAAQPDASSRAAQKP
jgi:hypothetical protein